MEIFRAPTLKQVTQATPTSNLVMDQTYKKVVSEENLQENEKVGSNEGIKGLPLELREMIWEYTMVDLPTSFTITKDTDLKPIAFYPNTLPQIAFTSRDVYEQVVQTWIRRTRFIFNRTAPFMRYSPLVAWLLRIPKGLESVRMVSCLNIFYFDHSILPPEMENHSRYLQSNGENALMGHTVSSITSPGRVASCFVNLTSVTIRTFAYYIAVVEGRKMGECIRLQTTEEIRGNWRFDRLFDLRKLRVFKMEIYVSQKAFRELSLVWGEESTFTNLMTVFRGGFEEKGRHMEVRAYWEGMVVCVECVRSASIQGKYDT